MSAVSDKNKALTVRFFDEAFNKGNLGIVDELLSPNYHYNGQAQVRPKGPRAWVPRACARSFRACISRWRTSWREHGEGRPLRWRMDIPKAAARPAGSIRGTNILSFVNGQRR